MVYRNFRARQMGSADFELFSLVDVEAERIQYYKDIMPSPFSLALETSNFKCNKIVKLLTSFTSATVIVT